LVDNFDNYWFDGSFCGTGYYFANLSIDWGIGIE